MENLFVFLAVIRGLITEFHGILEHIKNKSTKPQVKNVVRRQRKTMKLWKRRKTNVNNMSNVSKPTGLVFKITQQNDTVLSRLWKFLLFKNKVWRLNQTRWKHQSNLTFFIMKDWKISNKLHFLTICNSFQIKFLKFQAQTKIFLNLHRTFSNLKTSFSVIVATFFTTFIKTQKAKERIIQNLLKILKPREREWECFLFYAIKNYVNLSSFDI